MTRLKMTWWVEVLYNLMILAIGVAIAIGFFHAVGLWPDEWRVR